MENASKALFMAAGVLIGVMVLGIFVYLFRTGGQIGEKYDERQSREQLQLFNSKFESFDRIGDSGSFNTIIDMITVVNMAIDTNEKNEFASNRTVAIDIELDDTIVCVRDNEPLERNHLFVGDSGDEKIYVYDLLTKTFKELKESDTSININIQNTSPEGVPEDTTNDKLSIVNDNMKYKYWFKCEDIKYHRTTGRVKYMKFKLIVSNEKGTDGNFIWKSSY